MAGKKGKRPSKRRRPREERAPTLETMDGQTRASFIELVKMGFRFDSYLDPEQFGRLQTVSLRPRAYSQLLVNLMVMSTIDLACEMSDVPWPTVEHWVRLARDESGPIWTEFGFNYRRANALFESGLNKKLWERANSGDVRAIKFALYLRNKERYSERAVPERSVDTDGAAGVIGPRTLRLIRVTPDGDVLTATIGEDGPEARKQIDVTPMNGKARYPGGGDDDDDGDER